jgi:hypothetical protein
MEDILFEDLINKMYALLEEENPEEPEPLPGVDTLTKEQLRYILKNSKGKIMTIVYRKKDGSIRTINTRTGVKKNITGAGLKYNPDEHGYVILWDLSKQAYRTVNLNTVTALKGGGKVYAIKEAITKVPLTFSNGGINLTGEAAWNKWKRWADINRRDDYVYKVLETIKRQGYFATPKQHQVLVTWFNRKR